MWLTWSLYTKTRESETFFIKADQNLVMSQLSKLFCLQLPDFSFHSFVGLHSLFMWFNNQQQMQGIPVRFSGAIYLSRISLSSAVSWISSSFNFLNGNPCLFNWERALLCLDSLLCRKHLQTESQGDKRLILFDLFLRDECCLMSENCCPEYFVQFHSF